jgi:hypothetical protein
MNELMQTVTDLSRKHSDEECFFQDVCTLEIDAHNLDIYGDATQHIFGTTGLPNEEI